MEKYCLKKMKLTYRKNDVVEYQLDLGESVILNHYIGQILNFQHSGHIYCINCGKKTKKSFSQGYCFPCMRKLPQTDMCMVKPETCHYSKGTCRDPEWGVSHCMIPHRVYLANSSGLKVGITRDQPLRRWMDQGASQAMVMLETKSRLESGMVETSMKKAVSDKTNWRAMLKGEPEPVDLREKLGELAESVPDSFKSLIKASEVYEIRYPVEMYPKTVKSYNFDKTPVIRDRLMGMKGQYLIFEQGVLNIRKFTGYQVDFGVG